MSRLFEQYTKRNTVSLNGFWQFSTDKECKSVVMSEFGGAALYGNHTFDDIKWSEEYQVQLLTESIQAFLESGMVTGTYVWHFAEARTVRPSTDRARGFNNKGILNEYRKPKAAYFAVKKMY